MLSSRTLFQFIIYGENFAFEIGLDVHVGWVSHILFIVFTDLLTDSV